MMRKLSFLVVSFLVLGGFLLFNVSCSDDDNECGDSFCIGAIFPETGDASSAGPILKAAARLAESDINEAGGNIKIIFRDSGGKPEQADTAAQELLNMGVHGILGAWASTVSLGMIDRVTGNEVVMISPSNTSPSLTEYNEGFLMRRGVDYPYYYRTTPSDVFQGPIISKTLADDFTETTIDVVLIYRDDNWGVRLSQEINKAVEDPIDGKTINVETIDYDHTMLDDASTVTSLITRIDTAVDANTEAVILLVFDEGDEILRGMIKSSGIPNPGSDLKYYVGDGYVHPNIDERVRGNDPMVAEGATNGIKAVQTVPDPCRSKAFEQRLMDEAMINEFSFTGNAYDAIVLFALASLSAGSNEPATYVSEMIEVSGGGQACTTYEGCAALLTDDPDNDINYNGISGEIGFDQNGDITSALYAIFTYDNSTMGTPRTRDLVDKDGNSVNEPDCSQ